MSELNKLLEIITEVKNEMEKIDPNIKERLDYLNESLFESGDIIDIKEEQDEIAKCRDVDERFIPSMGLTEFGWKLETPTEGQPVKDTSDAPQARQELEAWLREIAPGADLMVKISELTNFFANPIAYMGEMGGSNIDNTLKTMSFLSFYKTLTDVITNFNASSAGFTFEAFLATLLRGKQIPAKNAETIGDMEDASGRKISLKLYDVKGAKAGGSWLQLVKDLKRDGIMQYVVVTKELTGEELEQQGTLNWYRWNFTLKNVFNIMSQMGSTEGAAKREFIWLPKTFGGGEWSAESLPRAGQIPVEKLQQDFEADVRKMGRVIKYGIPTEKGIQELIKNINWESDETHNTGGPGVGLLNLTKLKKALQKTLEENLEEFPGYAAHTPRRRDGLFDVIATKILNIDKAVIASNTSKRKVATSRRRLLRDPDMWMTAEDSKKWYNDSKRSDADRIRALENCKGTLMAKSGGGDSWTQFDLNLKNILGIEMMAGKITEDLFEPGQSKVGIGTIVIGRLQMADLFVKTGDLINNNLGQIWCHLDVLTRSLQKWYGSQLQDRKSGATAQGAALKIKEKTAEEIERKQ